MQLVKVIGKLNFYPKNVTRKHKFQSTWKRVALIETYCDIELYYAWFLKVRFGLTLNQTVRGTHISFINDKFTNDDWDKYAKQFHGKEIEFYHELQPLSDGKHWWFRVYSPDAEAIRIACGLNSSPYYGMHLTLGYANEKNIKHSEYILRQCKRFNLINYRERTKITEYEIINY